MNLYLLLSLAVGMLILIMYLFVTILNKDFSVKKNRKIYNINFIITIIITNYLEWKGIRLEYSNEFLLENLICLINLINIFLCLTLLLLLIFAKDKNEMKKRNSSIH